MTPEQLQTLKTSLLADQALAQYIVDYRDDLIRDYYNAPSSPAFTVWRTSVSQDEIMQNGFDWVRVDNLSVGKARIWEWLFDNQQSAISPTNPNVRAGINECWKGTAADLAVRAAVYSHCHRPVTRAERLFATGAGTAPSQDGEGPGIAAWTGTLTINDISAAMNG